MYRLCSVSLSYAVHSFCTVLFAKTKISHIISLISLSFLHGPQIPALWRNHSQPVSLMSQLISPCFHPSHHLRHQITARTNHVPNSLPRRFHPPSFTELNPSLPTAVDLTALYPPSLTPTILTTLRSYYHTTYKDQFFSPGGPPTAWFGLFLWMEALYHVPLSLWAVGALWDGM